MLIYWLSLDIELADSWNKVNAKLCATIYMKIDNKQCKINLSIFSTVISQTAAASRSLVNLRIAIYKLISLAHEHTAIKDAESLDGIRP